MKDSGPVALEVSLGEDDSLGRLHVEMAAYCDFDAWMDDQTQKLIDRWAHLAAPNSNRVRRASVSGIQS